MGKTHCVLTNTPEFEILFSEFYGIDRSFINPYISMLGAKVSVWQELNGLDNFPSVEQLRNPVPKVDWAPKWTASKAALKSEVEDKIQGSAKTIHVNSEGSYADIIWGTHSKRIVTQANAFKAAKEKQASIRKWAVDKFKHPHYGDNWTSIETLDDRVRIHYKVPPSVSRLWHAEVGKKDAVVDAYNAQFSLSLDANEARATQLEEAKRAGVEFEEGEGEFYQKDNSIEYNLKAVSILSSNKAKQVFAKGKKNGWDLNKILTELQVPKGQKQIILDKNINDREEIITSLLADNSFVVEVNTAKKGKADLDNYEEAYEQQYGQSNSEDNTQYYSNLTVPGGTNYTENEISTPSITPNIKGHAQFSTDNGIGWFRSDDKANNLSPIDAANNNDTNLTPFDNDYGKVATKTRRILEVQSDLFQKGRDEKDLVKPVTGPQLQLEDNAEFYVKNIPYYSDTLDGENLTYYKENDIVITREEYKKAYEQSKVIEKGNQKQNNFLQLLNKKGNWVNFFIQSIIQDSAKKGYEKVLFPKGDTAAKIEGHQTLEEFKKQKEDRIKELEKQQKKLDRDLEQGVYGMDTSEYDFSSDNINREIERLEQELADVESGQTQLSSIAKFYEDTVTNILKKNGYNPVEITDEYGNTWNEVDLSQEKARASIFLQKNSDSTGAMKALDKKVLGFLDAVGVSTRSVSEIVDRKGNPVTAIAKASILTKTIEVIEGKKKLDTLPEEAAHFYTAMLGKDNPLYTAMISRIESYPEYAEVKKEYADVYTTEEQFQFEAVGKVIAKAMVGKFNAKNDYKDRSWWKYVWDWIATRLGILDSNKVKEELDPFMQAAQDVLDANTANLKDINIGESLAPKAGEQVPAHYANNIFFQKEENIKTQEELKAKFLENANRYSKVMAAPDTTGVAKKYRIAGDDAKIERYYDTLAKRILKNRTTDLQTKVFIDSKGLEYARKMENSPDSIIQRDTGTFIHTIMEHSLLRLLRDTKNPIVDKSALEGKTVMPRADIIKTAKIKEKDLKKLEAHTKFLFNQIIEQQEGLNPKGKVVILPEAIIVNEGSDTGGTIDLLAIFSDASISMYDYKTLSPHDTKTDSKGNLIASPISSIKKNSYNSQISNYKDTLLEYGVSGVRQTRISPIQVSFVSNKNNLGGNFTDSIYSVATEKDSEFLKQLPVAFEQLGFDKIDALLKSIEQKIDILTNTLEGEENPKKREVIYRKLSSLGDTLHAIRVEKDVKQSVLDIRRTIISLRGKNMLGGKLNIHDPLHPDFMDIGEVMAAISDLEMYEQFEPAMRDYLLESQGEQGYREYRDFLTTVNGSITSTLSIAKTTLQARLVAKSAEHDEDFKGIVKLEIGRLDRLSEIDHPIVKTFFKEISQQQNKSRIAVKDIQENLKSLAEKLNKDSFEKMINTKTGNLYSRIGEDFFIEREKAVKSRNINFFKKHYSLPENYEEHYESEEKAYKARLDTEIQPVDDTPAEVKKAEESKKKMLDFWVNTHSSKSVTFWEKGGYGKIRIKPETLATYASKEYKALSTAEQEFYDYVVELNDNARVLLGEKYKTIPSNFLPNIRASVVESIANGRTPKEVAKETLDTFRIKESEDGAMYSKTDPVTGEILKSVPKFYLSPLRDSQGNVEPAMKSKEIAASMSLFMEMVYNYQLASESESMSNALVYALENEMVAESITNAKGDRIKTVVGDWANSLKLKPEDIEVFRAFVDKYIYGIHTKRFNKDSFLGSDFSTTKVIEHTKNYVGAKVLGLAVLPALAQTVAGRASISLEAKKGTFFTEENLKTYRKEVRDGSGKMHSMLDFFEAGQEDRSQLRTEGLLMSKLTKNATMNKLFFPYRKSDEILDNVITGALAQNWGLDADGNLRRMDRLKLMYANSTFTPVSIYESFTFDSKTGKSTMPISEKAYTAFRNLSRKSASGIKGLMTGEDVKYSDTNIILSTIMQFKNWMPGIWKERMKSLHYDKDYQIFEQGRHVVMWNSIVKKGNPEDPFSGILTRIAGSALNLAGGLINYKNATMSEEASIEYLQKYIDQHPEKGLSITEDLEWFMQSQKGQLRAAMLEIRILLTFASAIMALGGDWDDDDKADFKKYWATRQLYRIMQRTDSELLFMWNPLEAERLFRSPVPVVGVLQDMAKTVDNTIDVVTDKVTGDDARDKTPAGYYSSRWIPGIHQLRKILDMLFEEDKQRER